MAVSAVSVYFEFANQYQDGLTTNATFTCPSDGSLFPSERCINGSNFNNPNNHDWSVSSNYTPSMNYYSGTTAPSLGGDLLLVSGSIVGAVWCPYDARSDNSKVVCNVMVVGGSPTYCTSRRSFDVSDDVQGISDNGKYYYNSDGDYFNVTNDTLVADASDTANLPSGVSFNGWVVEDEIISGSDGNYYNVDGSQVFQNLPSGVIPTSTSASGVFEGSDGNYYNIDGDEILEYLPQGVTPVSTLGDVVLGSDNEYYKMDGSQAFENLPSGVSIVSYDSSSNDYVGSDGVHYDIDGNVAVHCNGDLLQYSNTIRLSIDAEDIFGNQVNIGGDIPIGTQYVQLPQGALIRKFNKIVARNMTDGVSCGVGNLNIQADIVGAKIGLDWEGVDIDAVLGTFVVADCIFQTCNKYADYVFNRDLPLGFTNLTALDAGYYCATDKLILTWEGFSNAEFPYCCPSYDTTVNESGSLGKDNDKIEVSDDCSCGVLEQIRLTLSDKLDGIIDKIDGLMCICDKFDSLVTAITNKDFTITVTPQITVEPSDVTVTNPVNNITVEPCSPVVTVTNPVNNVTVQSAVPDITVAPCQPTIQNVINEGDVNVDNSDIVDKLDELFKKDDDTITDILDESLHVTYQNSQGDMVTESITEIIKNKEDTNVFECIVEPVNMAYEGYGKYVSKDVLDDEGV